MAQVDSGMADTLVAGRRQDMVQTLIVGDRKSLRKPLTCYLTTKLLYVSLYHLMNHMKIFLDIWFDNL